MAGELDGRQGAEKNDDGRVGKRGAEKNEGPPGMAYRRALCKRSARKRSYFSRE